MEGSRPISLTSLCVIEKINGRFLKEELKVQFDPFAPTSLRYNVIQQLYSIVKYC